MAYMIRETIAVQTYGDYPTYATSDEEMVTSVLHLPSDKNKMNNKQREQPLAISYNKV